MKTTNPAEGMPVEWETALSSLTGTRSLRSLYSVIDDLYAPSNGAVAPLVFPRRDEVFRSFHLVAPHEVRAVIIGQDPYPQADPSDPSRGIADGLSFSARGHQPPESLRRLLYNLWSSREIQSPPFDADLRSWAAQGVLLINVALTVQPAGTDAQKRANFNRHRSVYAELIPGVVKAMSVLPDPPAFLLLGRHARALAGAVHRAKPDQVVAVTHPSRRGVWPAPTDDQHPFSTMNRFLDVRKIDWALP